MTLFDLIVQSCSQILRTQKADGSFTPGHNGPYMDTETPVRNTSHWVITLLKAYEITTDKKYYDAAINGLTYLLSTNSRPLNASFWHRTNPQKDFSNGLVGQAWTIEAFVYAYEATSEKKFLEFAEDVFIKHPYYEKEGGWMILNVDGSYAGLDGTFNHQVWFAAAGALLSKYKNPIIKERVLKFISRLNDHLTIYNDGCVRHLSSHFLVRSFTKKATKFLRQKLKGPSKDYLRMKSVGYHGFNMYGFSMIYNEFNDHNFWKSEKFLKALDYLNSEKYKKEIGSSKYGFPYNPPGFEAAYTLEVFESNSEHSIAYWLKRQVKECYNFESKMMSEGNSKDPITSAARLYEACRLNNYKLNI